MTSSEHQSGTNRINEVANILNLNDDEVIINVQADEPFIEKEVVQAVIDKVKTKNKEDKDKNNNKEKINKKTLFFDKICEIYSIEHRLTKHYHPQTNGMVKRMNLS